MWPANVGTNVAIFSKKEQCMALRTHLAAKYGIKKVKVYRGLFPSGFGGDLRSRCAYFIEDFEDLLSNLFLDESGTRSFPMLRSLYDAFSYEREYEMTHPYAWFLFSRFGLPLFDRDQEDTYIAIEAKRALLQCDDTGQKKYEHWMGMGEYNEGYGGSRKL
jgi:hypothetical protein